MEAHRRPDTEAGDDAKVVTEATGEYPLKPMALTAYKRQEKQESVMDKFFVCRPLNSKKENEKNLT